MPSCLVDAGTRPSVIYLNLRASASVLAAVRRDAVFLCVNATLREIRFQSDWNLRQSRGDEEKKITFDELPS